MLRRDFYEYTNDESVSRNFQERFNFIIKRLIQIKYSREKNKIRLELYGFLLRDVLDYVFPKNGQVFSRGLHKVYKHYMDFFYKEENIKEKLNDIKEALGILEFIMKSETREEVKLKCTSIYGNEN